MSRGVTISGTKGVKAVGAIDVLKLPDEVWQLIARSAVDGADIRDVRHYLVSMYDLPPVWRVEVTLNDGRELIGWVSPDMNVVAELQGARND